MSFAAPVTAPLAMFSAELTYDPFALVNAEVINVGKAIMSAATEICADFSLSLGGLRVRCLPYGSLGQHIASLDPQRCSKSRCSCYASSLISGSWQ